MLHYLSRINMIQVSKLFTATNIASAVTAFYLYVSIKGIANLMYPLRNVDVKSYPPQQLVRSYWYPTKHQSQSSNSKASESYHLAMKVYLSSNPEFHADFLVDEFDDKDRFVHSGTTTSQTDSGRVKRTNHDSILLWEQPTMKKFNALSKNLIITTHDEDDQSDSIKHATHWLQDAQTKADALSGITSSSSSSGLPIFQALSAASAGQGVASTSILLTMYHSIHSSIQSFIHWATSSSNGVNSTDSSIPNTNEENSPLVFRVSTSSTIWKSLMNNATVYLHVLLTRHEVETFFLPQISVSYKDELYDLQQAANTFNMLLGKVNMVKFDLPNHIPKPTRLLYQDILYLIRKYWFLFQGSKEKIHSPPWVMSDSNPKYTAYQGAQQMKKNRQGVPFWKPEVTIQMINDQQSYPHDIVHQSGMEIIQVGRKRTKNGHLFESGLAYLPGLYVDEIGLTSDKYIPLNKSSTALPLRISFQRNILSTQDEGSSTVESSHGMSPARWRLLRHLSESLEQQKQFGFEQSDIDDIRRLIAETNVVLLAITVLASTLHLLFEFLTFKSDVEFWRGNTDLTGLSVRALFMDFFSQGIVLLFLIEKDSSLLMIIPSAIGCLIALWKFQRGAGLKFVPVTAIQSSSWYNSLFRLFGYELQATRLRKHQTGSKGLNSTQHSGHDLAALTEEMDRLASKIVGKYFLIPIVIVYSIYTLLYQEHAGWYSWFISSASSAVYAIGFVLMTPQLFLNYKLKTVAHLPWNVLIFRFINTFIDDLFSFIIRMPTMARISCFRDDIVFLVYLYQRRLYPVDNTRVEGRGMDAVSAAASTARIVVDDVHATDKDKKDQ